MTRASKGRRSLLLVGPDGTGKSTSADLVTEELRDRGHDVVACHYRPGILWSRSEVVTTDPHGEAARPSWAAAAKMVAVFVDFALGYLGPWRRRNRSGFVVLERGWWDHEVDPTRYRVPAWLPRVFRWPARLFPRADVVAILAGEPSAIVDRKPELDVAEVSRQLDEWRVVATRAGRRVIEIDTTRSGPDEVAGQLVGALDSRGRRWLTTVATPNRVDLRVTAGVGGSRAMEVYQPTSRQARAALPVGRALVRMGIGRATEAPFPAGEEPWSEAGLGDIEGLAVMASSTPGRLVVGICCDQRLAAVAKVGPLDDDRLRNEAEMLDQLAAIDRLAGDDRPFAVPAVRWAGEHAGRFTLITEAVAHHGPPAMLDDVWPVLLAMADLDGRALHHGDLAPWNLRRGRDGILTLIDLEYSAWESRPLFDLAHFVVQGGALLGRSTPGEAVTSLCADSGRGRSYLDAVDVDDRPSDLVKAYLDHRSTWAEQSEAETRFVDQMRVALTPA